MRRKEAREPLYEITFFHAGGQPKLKVACPLGKGAEIIAYWPDGSINQVQQLTLDELVAQLEALRRARHASG